MTEGTSQGLFIVVAIVIFGIFVSLSYTLFGKTLQPQMVDLFTEAVNSTKNYTESDFFTFEKSTGTIVDYNEEDGPLDVVIPEKIDGIKVKSITNLAFSDKGINSLVLQENLETLIDGTVSNEKDPETGEVVITGRTGAFYNNNLTEITLPKSMKNIGERAFMYNDLTDIVIPDNVEIVSVGAFKGNKLENIKIGKKVERIAANSFEENNLTDVYLPENITSIGIDAFRGNENLKTITLPRHLEDNINIHPRTVAKAYDNATDKVTMPELIFYD